MAPQFMMSLWIVLDDLVEHSRCRSEPCGMRAGGNAGTVVCNSAFLHTARLKTAAPCAIPRFFTHRKTRKRRSVCNSAFLHTARPVTRRRLGIRQAFRRPEMPFSTAFSVVTSDANMRTRHPKCRFQRLSASASPQNALFPRLQNPKAFF